MNRRNRIYNKPNRFKNIILNHIENNIKEYAIIAILFLIGLFVGIVFINNLTQEQAEFIRNYLQTSISNLKNEQNIDCILLLKNSLSKNFILVLLLWFMGSTVIGIVIVYLLILFRGFCLGYTISSIIYVLGTAKGSLFLASTMLIQNIFFIPCLISLGVSSINLYKSIMEDRRKENIKLEIIRHTFFSIFIFIVLIISSVLEAYVSTKILELVIQYV